MLKAKFHKNLEFVKENFLVTFQKKDLMIKISNVFSVPVQVLIFRLFASQNLNGSKPQCCPPRYLNLLNISILASQFPIPSNIKYCQKYVHTLLYYIKICKIISFSESVEQTLSRPSLRNLPRQSSPSPVTRRTGRKSLL